ncbi:MAG: hypothetical protein MRY78_19180 [Saprospiraceae bacterium]|nr:hypothetical protein [Saprospiraceae bacterium]
MIIFEDYQTVPVIALRDMDPYMQVQEKRQSFPLPGEEFSFFRLDLSMALIKNPEATFFIQATEDSLVAEGIFPGDILIVDRLMEARHGAKVVVFIEGEFVLRKLILRADGMALQKADGSIEIEEIEPEMAFGIWGVIRDHLQVRLEAC